MKYSHSQIEKKWINNWISKKIFSPLINDFSKPKYYILDMFPYPSGIGMHVGHLRGYLATDILSRMKRMQGFNVLHPLGFDSFGLPAEQFAIKTGASPKEFTWTNMNNFVQQFKNLGFGFSYENFLYTSDPKYFHWTQWTFLKFFEHKLAKLKMKNVNYCAELSTVLANEEIISENGKMISERGGFPVVRQKQKQWVISLTSFANDLLSNLKNLNWPDSIKKAQTKWIGKSTGRKITISDEKDKKINFHFFVKDLFEWADTKFVVLSLEDEKYDQYLSSVQKNVLNNFRKTFSSKPITDKRLIINQPVGFKTNWKITNPLTKKLISVYFSELVDYDFAFGTSLGRPLWNHQDWFFAHFHKIDSLPIKPLINQRKISLKDWKEKHNLKNEQILSFSKKPEIVFFKIKDWIFSRQRYWGEPFPVKFEKNKIILLKEKELPLELPLFSPDLWKKISKKSSITPLANFPNWKKEGYDLNTMPQWAGSCWYFLAYILRKENDYIPLNSPLAKKLLNYWLPVDFYIGGQEHAVSHLLYSRFWNHFLTKLKIYDHQEPFKKLKNQGIILSSSGKKMSKSQGNVVNPLDFLISHGADAIRLHEKFLGPFAAKIKWNSNHLDAMRKWLARVYIIFFRENFWMDIPIKKENRYLHAHLIKNVTTSFTKLTFNVGISQLMAFINFCYRQKSISKQIGLDFLKLLHPICPHITDEIAEKKWNLKKSLTLTKWPSYLLKNLENTETKIALQINGKLKKIILIKTDEDEKTLIQISKNHLIDFLIGKRIKKCIFIKNKIINFVLE